MNPQWSKWAWDTTTASRSWIENSGTPSIGNEVFSSCPATFTPQSSNTLLFGVWSNIQERPTSLNPPIAVNLVQSLSYFPPWWILAPKVCKIFFLSLLLCIKVFLILSIISDLIGGLLKIFGAHPVFLTISLEVTPYFPITSPGLVASITTSLVTSSKVMLLISASSGTISSTFWIVSSYGNKTDLSDLIMILFLSSFAKFLIKSPLSATMSGFFVYITTSGPSNSILANWTSSGSFFVIFCLISSKTFEAILSLRKIDV